MKNPLIGLANAATEKDVVAKVEQTMAETKWLITSRIKGLHPVNNIKADGSFDPLCSVLMGDMHKWVRENPPKTIPGKGKGAAAQHITTPP